MNLKTRILVQIEIGGWGIFPLHKNLLNQCWGELWYHSREYKKICLRYVIAARKYRKWFRDREISEEQLYRQHQIVQEAPNTVEHHVVILRTPFIKLKGETQTYMDAVLVK